MTSENVVSGVGASPGIAIGPVIRITAVEVEVPEVESPAEVLEEAMSAASTSLEQLSAAAREHDNAEAADVLFAQSLMAADPMIAEGVRAELDAGKPFNAALDDAAATLAAMLAGLDDPYLAARASDVGEVVQAIKREIVGEEVGATVIDEPSILLAHDLTAAETADLDPSQVLGFATATGGATSHVAIIARSLGLPAVAGVADGLDRDASFAALDGSTGEVVLDPSDEQRRDFEDRRDRWAGVQGRAAEALGSRASFDGTPMVVSANVGSTGDIDRASEVRADGIGLFRTEFLFLEQEEPPTEDEQYELYRSAAGAFDDTVVVRTFDIGGDKPAKYLEFGAEENPFLGTRGVRVYWPEHDLFATQIRALLRSARFGDVAAMLPMISTVEEVERARAVVDHVRHELDADGIEHAAVAVGVMIEVPSAAVMADQLAAHVDFFSIGTNDLTQYTFAADRTLASLAHLQDPLHPAVLRLCKMVADAGAAADISTSVCGLAAADPIAAVIYASMGIGKLSVSAGSVNVIKATLSAQGPSLRARIAEALESARSAEEVRSIVGSALVEL